MVSLNFSGLEKDTGFPMTLPLMRKVIACIFYGDLLVALRSQTEPYEDHPGAADAATERWVAEIQSGCGKTELQRPGYEAPVPGDRGGLCRDPPFTVTPKVKVGVVGEIYVKYSPLGNNDLEKFLDCQDCEVNLPGLMGFVQYCIANQTLDRASCTAAASWWPAGRICCCPGWIPSGKADDRGHAKNGFHAPRSFRELMKMADGIISLGQQNG